MPLFQDQEASAVLRHDDPDCWPNQSGGCPLLPRSHYSSDLDGARTQVHLGGTAPTREAQEGGRREGAHQDDFAAVGGGSCKLNVPLPAKATRGLMMRLLQDANYDSGLHHRPLPTIQGMDVSRSPQRLLGLGAQADQSQPKCAQ